MPDVQEVATRKLGPLPTWGWAVAIAGAVVVAKIVRGNKGSTSSGTTTVVGGSPASSDIDGDGGSDIFSGPNSLVQQLQTDIGSLGSINGLLTKLNAAINQRSSLLSTRATLQTQLNSYHDALRACKTTACKTKQKKLIATATNKQKANTTALGTVNALIADLQKQLASAQTKG